MAKISYDDIIEKDILELLGIQNIPDDQKKAIYEKLYQIVENRAILRIDHLLSGPDVEEWKKILDSGDRAKADEFLKSKDIDVQRILIEEVSILKAQLVFMMNPEETEDAGKAPVQSPVEA